MKKKISTKNKSSNGNGVKADVTRSKPIAYSNTPNKDIARQIHRGCFDYKDMDKKVMGKRIEERVYLAYNGVFEVIKDWIEADEKDFLNFVKKMKIDKSIKCRKDLLILKQQNLIDEAANMADREMVLLLENIKCKCGGKIKQKCPGSKVAYCKNRNCNMRYRYFTEQNLLKLTAHLKKRP